MYVFREIYFFIRDNAKAFCVLFYRKVSVPSFIGFLVSAFPNIIACVSTGKIVISNLLHRLAK